MQVVEPATVQLELGVFCDVMKYFQNTWVLMMMEWSQSSVRFNQVLQIWFAISCIVSRYHWVRGRRGSDRGLLGLKIGLICMIADNVEESEHSWGDIWIYLYVLRKY